MNLNQEILSPKGATAAVLAATVLLLLSFGAAAAQETSLGAQSNVKLDLLVLTGKGVAVSSTDAMDAHIVKVGVGRVHVAREDATVAAKAGVLFFDDQKYRLADVVASDATHVTASVKKEDAIV